MIPNTLRGGVFLCLIDFLAVMLVLGAIALAIGAVSLALRRTRRVPPAEPNKGEGGGQ